MAGWTRAIVRLDGVNRMVTKGYQKGVYEWVTKGIMGQAAGNAWSQMKLEGSDPRLSSRTSLLAPRQTTDLATKSSFAGNKILERPILSVYVRIVSRVFCSAF
jgi:hypothetical protein